MAQAGRSTLPVKPPAGLVQRQQYSNRREGSLGAALAQSMALAVISTAGAYPNWVRVAVGKRQVLLGATWAIKQTDPPPNSPLLGSNGAALLLAMAFCCLFSVLTGSSAIWSEFVSQRKCRKLGPLLHGLTALLIFCTTVLGSTLLGTVRDRVETVPELKRLKLAADGGKSLYLSILAWALSSTAAGLSCRSPASAAAARLSRDAGRAAARRRRSVPTDSEDSSSPARPRFFSWQDSSFSYPLDSETTSSSQSEEERPRALEWYHYFKRELAETSWQDLWWRRQSQPQQQAALGEEGHCSGQRREPVAQEEEGAVEKHWEPPPLPQKGIQSDLAAHQIKEDEIHTRLLGEKETDQEDPGRGDAELQLSLAPESQRVKSGEKTSQTSENQASEAGLVESLDREKQDAPNYNYVWETGALAESQEP